VAFSEITQSQNNMRYTVSNTISKPIEQVVKEFSNQENKVKWMDGLQSFEQVDGEPLTIGSKSRLTFAMGRRTLVMTQIILENKLPESLKLVSKSRDVNNMITHRFKALAENETYHETTHVFEFKNWGMKLLSPLMKKAFMQQSQTYLDNFKKFIETI